MDNAGQWLLGQQDPATGGWADRCGGHINALNTAETMIGLIDAGILNAGADPVQKGVQFLLTHQFREGPNRGSWPREIVSEQGITTRIPDIVRTSFAIQALIKAGVGFDQEAVQDALNWLVEVRDEKTKGWGYAPGKPSELMPTCFVLSAQLEVYKASQQNRLQEQIQEGLKYIVDTYYKSGGDEERGSFGEPNSLRAVHTIYSALVLQMARCCNLSLYTNQEKEAIKWLQRHPDSAIRLTEEWVDIEKNSGAGNQSGGYGFMFMSDTLLIRLLMGSDNVDDRASGLADHAMNSLKDKLNETTGAFYGYRECSWSTAKALSALSVLRKHTDNQYPDFPHRDPEFTGWTTGPFILGFVILLSIFGFYLMVEEKFNLLAFSFFTALIMAALLAYGAIGEKTFKELFRRLMNPLT